MLMSAKTLLKLCPALIDTDSHRCIKPIEQFFMRVSTDQIEMKKTAKPTIRYSTLTYFQNKV